MNKLQKLISKLEKHHKRKIDLSLHRCFNLLQKLGDPQDKIQNIVTVVGTNSKASLCSSLKSILNKATFVTLIFMLFSSFILSYLYSGLGLAYALVLTELFSFSIHYYFINKK